MIAKPQLEDFHIINPETVIVEHTRKKVELNKPIYTGFCILGLSKVLMYEFHYRVVLKRYGTNAKLLFTDTDSLCYSVSTDDFYKDMVPFKDFLDTSDYPVDHILHSPANKKVIGKLKDECNGKAPLEFIGLRSKMYSLLVDKAIEKKRVKGITITFRDKHVRHAMYRRVG